MKRCAIVVLIVCLTFLVTCGSKQIEVQGKHKEQVKVKTQKNGHDYTKLYAGYLDYSLGHWKVKRKEYGYTEIKGGKRKYFTDWYIEYKDSGNKKQILHINNFNIGCTDRELIGFWVHSKAQMIIEAQLENKVLRKYFTNRELKDYDCVLAKSACLLPVNQFYKKPKVENPYYNKIITAGTGIKLKNINCKALAKYISKVGLTYEICFIISVKKRDINEINKLKIIRESVVKELLKSFNNNVNIEASIYSGKIIDSDKCEYENYDNIYFDHGKKVNKMTW